MYSLTKGAMYDVRCATRVGRYFHRTSHPIHRRTSHIAQFLVFTAALAFFSCSEERSASQRSFFNIDSLISFQVNHLKGRYELNKVVEIDGKEEHTRFVPDSVQWARELDIFRQLEQVNKAAYRDAYDVRERRDTNSNLTVREIKLRPGSKAPVLGLELYYLNDPADLRRISAVVGTENALYTKLETFILEFEAVNGIHLVQRYRIEGTQKMVADDVVHFVIAGETAM